MQFNVVYSDLYFTPQCRLHRSVLYKAVYYRVQWLVVSFAVQCSRCPIKSELDATALVSTMHAEMEDRRSDGDRAEERAGGGWKDAANVGTSEEAGVINTSQKKDKLLPASRETVAAVKQLPEHAALPCNQTTTNIHGRKPVAGELTLVNALNLDGPKMTLHDVLLTRAPFECPPPGTIAKSKLHSG